MNGSTASTSVGYVHLKVYGQDHTTVKIKIRKDVPLQYLMNAYCENVGIQRDSVKFLFDGQVLRNEDTAISLEIEDNDFIETYKKQISNTPSPSYIQAKILRIDNATLVEFKIEKHVPLKNLMDAYCEYVGLQKNSIGFIFGGRLICEEDTATSIGLKNDYIIEISTKRK